MPRQEGAQVSVRLRFGDILTLDIAPGTRAEIPMGVTLVKQRSTAITCANIVSAYRNPTFITQFGDVAM